MIELHIQGIKSTAAQDLSDFLMELGALSITLIDSADCPVLEPAPGETPLWPEVTLKAMFQDETHMSLCEHVLHLKYPALQTSRYIIQDRTWEDEWKTQSSAMCFGERLWVKPSHFPSTPSNSIDVILDPGLAFGTGSHPTTALCLKWLDAHHLENKVVMDYGCGTGILMIAALKLGAQFAYGIDIDPQALIATEQNAALNHIDAQLFQVGPVESAQHIPPVDIILANILLNPLIELKTNFFNQLKQEGKLVVSGILVDQVPHLIQAYQPEFKCVTVQQEAEWSACEFTK